MDSLVNFGKAVLSTNYNASSTSIVLTAAQFAKLPQTAPYNLVWWNHTDFPSPEDDSAVEIVRVTALNAGAYTLTITRAQEGTAAVDHNISGKEYWLMNGLTKAVMNAIQAGIDGKAATSHTHLLAAGATDVTATAAELNQLHGKTLVLPASTTISAAGAELINDADSSAQRATLGAVATGDSRLSDARVASDVYAWAKAATSPNPVTLSTADPSGGGNGDIWIKYTA